MQMRIQDLFRRVSLSLALAFALVVCGSTVANAQTKIACIGEATTHSAHRIHDPEYPEFMGRFLDSDFQLESQQNPLDGGMLYGGGTNYRIGNFGLPTGTALRTDSNEVAPNITSPQLLTAEEFGPDVVVLGPYGPHEPYAEVDIDANFVPDLTALAERILAFPSQPTVFIALPIARYGEDNDTVRRKIHEYTVQVAEQMNLPMIDLWTEFMGKRVEFYDQNHLAEAGRRRHGEFVGAAIQQWKEAGGGSVDNPGAGGSLGMGGSPAMAGGPGTDASLGGSAAGGATTNSGGAALGNGGSSSDAIAVMGGAPSVDQPSGGAPAAGGAAPSVASGGSNANAAMATASGDDAAVTGASPSPDETTMSVGNPVGTSTPMGAAGSATTTISDVPALSTGSEPSAATSGATGGAQPNAESSAGCGVSPVPSSTPNWLLAFVGLSLLAGTRRGHAPRNQARAD